MKEAWRLQKHSLTENLESRKKYMSVFFIYTGKELPLFSEVENKTEKALNRLQKIINESAVADS